VVGRSLIRPAVLALAEYDAGEDLDETLALRADRNESALAPPSHVIEAVRGLDGSALRRYPTALLGSVQRGLAERLQTGPDRVAIGTGADGILAAIGAAVLDPGDTVVTVTPTFAMYAWLAGVAGARLRTLPYARRWELDVDALATLARGARLVILGHPNNPTGEALELRDVARIAAALPQTLVAVDEVYLSLRARSLLPAVSALDNVAVIGSLSKVAALAGLRVGYAVGDSRLATALRRVMPPFPVSAASLAAADAYLSGGEATARFEAALDEQNVRSLDRIVSEIGELAVDVWRSCGNFVLMDFGPRGEALAALVRLRGVAVRTFTEPELVGCVRFCALDDLSTTRLIKTVREAAATLGMRAARA
jgi:histidinol-phosphate aminotransferase